MKKLLNIIALSSSIICLLYIFICSNGVFRENAVPYIVLISNVFFLVLLNKNKINKV